MVMRIFVVLIGCFLFHVGVLASTHINPHHPTDLEEAKERALSEGKFFMVSFGAKWCRPCKWMAETTFADSLVRRTLDQNFVWMQLDIDESLGYEMKNRYEVKYLPTMLIFNPNGQMVHRIEETLSPEAMKSLLGLCLRGELQPQKIHRLNISPKDINKSEPTERSRNTGFQLQMGVFSSFEGAKMKVDQLQQIFGEPIVVLQDAKDGKIFFRVVMGFFETKERALAYASVIKNSHNFDSVLFH